MEGKKATRPKMSFRRRLLKKEPWQASWPMRNRRTMPAVMSSEPTILSHSGVSATTRATPPVNTARSTASATKGRR